MPPKIKPDDLVEALLDGRVVEALAKALSPFINKTINECLAERLADITKSLVDVKQANDLLQNQVGLLKRENDGLRQQMTSQTSRIEALETYSRLDNPIVKGLPEQSYAERGSPAANHADDTQSATSHLAVESTVLSFIRDRLHVECSPSDISTAHRIKAGPKDTIRPIIVRFTNRRVRDNVYRAKKQLKATKSTAPVFISEHLTKSAADLFYEARKLLRAKKIHSAWSQNGQVRVKFDNGPTTKPSIIKCRDDLFNFVSM